ncbi:MAG: YggS family pyridoxal phosphate-dependent enzyme [Niabella sp.]
MSINKENYNSIIAELKAADTTLVAVSKTKPIKDIAALYDLGQRNFGENYVQELVEKSSALPTDIRWHFIGHLQSNKVKYIASFVHLIHGIDSEKLLREVNKQAAKNNRIINCLLQVHIAQEETKFGFDVSEVQVFVNKIMANELDLPHVNICGLMGMASFSDNLQKVQSEFEMLAALYKKIQSSMPTFNTLSMGMSGDYKLAVQSGSTMVRIGSLLFGARN